MGNFASKKMWLHGNPGRGAIGCELAVEGFIRQLKATKPLPTPSHPRAAGALAEEQGGNRTGLGSF